MGTGIAQVFASAGHRVAVYEPAAEVRRTVRVRINDLLRLYRLDESVASRILVTGDLDEAVTGGGLRDREAAP